MSTSPGISAFPADDADLTRWVGKIVGPEGTVSPSIPDGEGRVAEAMEDQVYAGLAFRISLHFPPTYPFTAPVVRFETPCYRA